jgi:predicted esterase
MQGSRIGATWMTREDRLNEIKDYINYLDMVYQQIFTSVSRTQVKVHALGFSQGVATVCRWLNAGNAHADRLILWAGQLPTELDTEGNWEIFQKLPTAIVIGNQDEFAEWSIVNHQAEILKKHHIDYQLITFEGTHKLDRNVLTRLAVS